MEFTSSNKKYNYKYKPGNFPVFLCLKHFYNYLMRAFVYQKYCSNRKMKFGRNIIHHTKIFSTFVYTNVGFWNVNIL
ncbi:hypothetical protein FK004_11065 [Flavobacterium kingsejongi]|uniref:Uncharacterized protein n=1 Tax=Flavobacterium kingsejongi TaxID=1678728 RepID=A0A2S1LPS0_9FLAO|nr:hypothetical protein FK004_11065 [Flavobacterium kingsejongi]